MKGNTQLSARQREILRLLLSKHGHITVRGLADQYRLGSRSIRNDLNTIGKWLGEHSVPFYNEGGTVQLVVSAQQAASLKKILQKESGQGDFLEKRERVHYIVSRLVLAVKPVTSMALCEELQVSKPTILADLESADRLVQKKHLSIERKKGRGYWISGEEIQLRGEIAKRLLLLLREQHVTNAAELFRFCKECHSDSRDAMQRYLAAADPDPVRRIVEQLWSDTCVVANGENTFSFSIWLAVILQRLKAGFTIQSGEELPETILQDTPMLQLADKLFAIAGEYGVAAGAYERRYLVCKLYQCGIHLKGRTDAVSGTLADTVDRMLQTAQALFPDSELKSDGQLRAELIDYLDFVLRRRALGVKTYNPFFVKTRAMYPQLYMAAEKLAAVFKEAEHTDLTQDETGTVTLLLAAYGAFDPVGRRTLLVCDKDDTLAKLMARRLHNNLPELTVIGCVPLNEYISNPQCLSAVEMIVSTVELPDAGVPVFVVDPIIDYADLQRIRDYVCGTKTIGIEWELPHDHRQLEEYVTSLAGDVLSAEDIRALSTEMEHYLFQNSRWMTIAGLSATREEYSRRLATILSKVSGLADRAEEITGKRIETDNLLGLTIHLTLSLVLWENDTFYPETRGNVLEGENPQLAEAVEHFLTEVGEIIGSTLPKSEGIAILQYFKDYP